MGWHARWLLRPPTAPPPAPGGDRFQITVTGTQPMVDDSQGMVAFLGVPPDTRLLGQDLVKLPAAEQHGEPAGSSLEHDRLVAAGSLLTGITLVGGTAMLLF